MSNSSIVGGVSFHGGKIQAAAIEEQGDDFTLQSIQEVQYDAPNGAWKNLVEVPNAAAKLANVFSTVFDSNALPQQISVALPADSAMLLTTPIDPTLSTHDLKQHIEWELSNYYQGQRRQDLISSYVSLDNKSEKQTTNILIVALQRSILQLLRMTCERLESQLHIVDISHFCVEPVLAKIHPISQKQDVLLVGNEGNRIQASLVSQSRLRRYRYGDGSTDHLKAEFIKNFLADCGSAKLQDAYFYGDALEPRASAELKSSTGIDVKYVDTESFRSLPIVSQSLDIRDGKLHPSRFAPSIGIAMRTT